MVVRMATIKLHETTTATPEQVLAALVDFGPGRQRDLRPQRRRRPQGPLADAAHADVTEGSGGVWERLATTGPTLAGSTITTDSNTWGGRSATPTP